MLCGAGDTGGWVQTFSKSVNFDDDDSVRKHAKVAHVILQLEQARSHVLVKKIEDSPSQLCLLYEKLGKEAIAVVSRAPTEATRLPRRSTSTDWHATHIWHAAALYPESALGAR